MKIAIYGGTFNPPHVGHTHAVRIVREAIRPDRILVIPAFVPPHKPLAEGSPSASMRLALCRIAFAEQPDVEVSDLELKRKKRSYSFDTIRQLSKEAPSNEFVLTVGTDQFLNFETWYRFEDILRMVRIAVLSREDGDRDEIARYAEKLKKEYSARITVIENPVIEISSSQIREALRGERQRELAERFLDPEVLSFIDKNGLYRK